MEQILGMLLLVHVRLTQKALYFCVTPLRRPITAGGKMPETTMPRPEPYSLDDLQ